MFKNQFPACQQSMNDEPLVYLDNAATTQKPRPVIDAMCAHLQQARANVHRANYTLAAKRTDAFEAVRQKTARFIGAHQAQQIIWTKGTTESINLVCQTLLPQQLRPGDEILITAAEHHANLVPWQQWVQKYHATLVVSPLTPTLDVDLPAFKALLSAKTRLVAMTHVSNVTGKIHPVAEMVRAAKMVGAITLIDGAQAVAHLSVDVQALDCDFYAFSSHKMYGPTGLGVLYGQWSALKQLSPWLYGGEMVSHVTYEKAEFAPLPFRLEAGTPPIEAVLGFGAAIEFLQGIPMQQRLQHEQSLANKLREELQKIPGLCLLGDGAQSIGIFSFVLENVHAFDLGTLLDMQGVAVRIGTHCATPLIHSLGFEATVRASMALSNDVEDIECFLSALHKARMLL